MFAKMALEGQEINLIPVVVIFLTVAVGLLAVVIVRSWNNKDRREA